jgi:hypothetical protein
MPVVPVGLFIGAEANRIRERREQVATMVANFSATGVTPADGQLTAAVAQHAYAWVAGQLGKPETAMFHDGIARLCPNQTVLFMGRVTSQNVTGNQCSNWFIVEFDLVTQMGSGAMLDDKPAYREQLPPLPSMPGGQLSYEMPVMPRAAPRPPRTSWPLTLLVIVLLTTAFFLILAIFQVG